MIAAAGAGPWVRRLLMFPAGLLGVLFALVAGFFGHATLGSILRGSHGATMHVTAGVALTAAACCAGCAGVLLALAGRDWLGRHPRVAAALPVLLALGAIGLTVIAFALTRFR